MKRKIIWSILYSLLIGAELWALQAVARLNMLPTGYLIAVAVLLAAMAFAVGRLLFRKDGKVRKVIACVLALVMICGCAVISTVAHDVSKTLAATSREEPDIMTREIFVLAENDVAELKDTAGYTFGYIKNYDETCTRQVIDQITLDTAGMYATAGYTNLFNMVNALLDGKIDAMILNGGFGEILEETKEFFDFSTRTRILLQVPVDGPEVELQIEDVMPEPAEPGTVTAVTEAEEETQPQPAEEAAGFTRLEPFMVYVSGSDSHSEVLSSGRSDVNILAAVNPMTKQVLLINTPRDYYVPNSAGGGVKDKLTHCGLYGISCSMNTLGSLYDEEIEYYVQLNFAGFKKLIDALGGITVYSDYAFTAIQRTDIKEGKNELTGQEALDFARERKTLSDGDNERGKHQMQVIEAVIQKATSGSTIISNYSDIMASIEGMFTMNLPAEMIGSLIKMQLSDMARWNIVTYSATGSNSYEECYSLQDMELAVIIPYQSSVSKATRLIDMVYAGELLTEEVINSMA